MWFSQWQNFFVLTRYIKFKMRWFIWLNSYILESNISCEFIHYFDRFFFISLTCSFLKKDTKVSKFSWEIFNFQNLNSLTLETLVFFFKNEHVKLKIHLSIPDHYEIFQFIQIFSITSIFIWSFIVDFTNKLWFFYILVCMYRIVPILFLKIDKKCFVEKQIYI